MCLIWSHLAVSLILVIICHVRGDDVEICLSDVKATECPTPGYYGLYENRNRLTINKDQISVVEANTGVKASSLRLPGRYKIVFGSILVNTDLNFLVSDMKLEVDVPTYGRINAMPTCDNNSHPVTVDGPRNYYCRYCDMCEVSRQVEDDLDRQKVLPSLQTEKRFSEDCRSMVRGKTYSVERTVSVPSFDKLQEEYAGKVDRRVEDALLQGKGKMYVQLRLLNKIEANDRVVNMVGQCILMCAQKTGPQCARTPWSQGCITEACKQQCQAQQNINQTRIERDRCESAAGYMEGFELAACYNIEFTYDAAYVSRNHTRQCPKQRDACQGERPFCCGCSDCRRFGLPCSVDCTEQPRGSCAARF